MAEKIYSVSEITKNIKQTLEGNPYLSGIWVRGEIYNLTLHSSGHIYFTLKDKGAVINVTFFRNANKSLKIKLSEGMDVLAFGNITLFEKRGSYQLNVIIVKPEGIGELQKQIEQLKKQLGSEGIFDPLHKKELPFLPRKLGIVTSPTGAAIRDIIKVALRRYPGIEILIAPAKVQGDDAPATIVRAIRELNKEQYNIDIIIAGRGGGSFEDLMPFNTEEVVRAFYESEVPIVSAVGHQVDHPLSDDAADIAAPTPSAAAEIAVPVKQELKEEIEYYLMRINQSVVTDLREKRTALRGIQQKRIFSQPLEIVNRFELVVTDAENSILYAMKNLLNYNTTRFFQLPDFKAVMKNYLKNKSHQFGLAVSALHQLSPLAVMQRGYAIALDKGSSVIKSVQQLQADDVVDLVLVDGSADCTVNRIHKGVRFGKEKNGSQE